MAELSPPSCQLRSAESDELIDEMQLDALAWAMLGDISVSDMPTLDVATLEQRISELIRRMQQRLRRRHARRAARPHRRAPRPLPRRGRRRALRSWVSNLGLSALNSMFIVACEVFCNILATG